MKVFRKLGVAALVVMLAMCFCSVAYADNDPTALVASNYISAAEITDISFSAGLAATTNNVPRPGVSITYTISDGTSKTVTTDGATSPTVSFVADATNNISVSGSTATIAYPLDNSGTAANRNLHLQITNYNTAAYGVHTYTITESVTAAQQTAGFAAPSGTDNNGVAETTYTLKLSVNSGKVVQAILDKSSSGNSTDANDKVAGFAPITYTPAAEFTLAKFATGEGAGKKFNFTVTIAAPTGEAATGMDFGTLQFTVVSDTKNSNPVADSSLAPSTTTALSSGGAELSGYLTASATTGTTLTSDVQTATDSKLTISGLPVGTTITVTEGAAELTAYDYTASSYAQGSDGNYGAQVTYGASDAKTATVTLATAARGIRFINELLNISLTGVSLRYAPYVLTLGAGLVVLPLSRGWKRREEED